MTGTPRPRGRRTRAGWWPRLGHKRRKAPTDTVHAGRPQTPLAPVRVGLLGLQTIGYSRSPPEAGVAVEGPAGLLLGRERVPTFTSSRHHVIEGGRPWPRRSPVVAQKR